MGLLLAQVDPEAPGDVCPVKRTIAESEKRDEPLRVDGDADEASVDPELEPAEELGANRRRIRSSRFRGAVAQWTERRICYFRETPTIWLDQAIFSWSPYPLEVKIMNSDEQKFVVVMPKMTT